MKKILMVVLVILLYPATAYAQTPSSANYSVPESGFQSGSNIDSNSASYNARVSAGDLGIGNSNSTNYNARPGFVTPDEEFLEFVVQTSDVDLGALDTVTTGVGTGAFYIRTYINGSYAVYSMSTTLESEGGADIDALTSPTAASVGTEQFGFNLVDNATPNIGVDPAPDPTTDFANGEAAPDYDTADSYKSAAGDIIARSGSVGQAWGRTNFTISYIANISSITEAGTYTMNHDLVAAVTY